MTPIMLGIYMVLCMVLGIVGRGSRIGFFGIFLLSVIFTPLLVGVILSFTRPLPVLKAPKGIEGK
jgi:hypothetical protein